MIVCDAFGCFRRGQFAMVPYQHHASRHTWKVFVTKKIFKEDTVEYEHECANVFARTAIEAAALGIEYFERMEAAGHKLQSWYDEERAKQIKRQMQRSQDGPEQTVPAAAS